MKNLAIFGLAAATASIAAGSLWNMEVDAYQVQVPETVSCDKTGDDYGAACYESTGGWWFAYVGDEADGQTMSFSPIDKNPDGTYKLITTDETDGSIIAGGNLIEGTGLVVTMSAGGGAASTPAIAGIGFNWTKTETPIDISAHAGYCIQYAWTGSSPLQMELGWDEAANGYDSWYSPMPAQASASVLDLPWAKFKQDGWDKAKKAITVAQSQAVSLKIRLKVATAAEVKGTLTIADLGWSGECSGVASTPSTPAAIGDKAAQASLKAQLSGRTLSFGKTVAKAEVINLQGQVIMAASSVASMDLSKVQAGVYMVRAEGLSQQIMVK